MLNMPAARRVAKSVRNHVRPLNGMIGLLDYHHIRRERRFNPGKVRLFGRPFTYSDNVGFLHSAQEVFQDKVYQFRARRERPRIIDAGANIGLSVLFFKRLYPNSSVVAYEPDADIFTILRDNVGTMPGVELHHAAAWVEDTTLSFFREKSLAGSVSADFMGLDDRVDVPAERLRDEVRKGPVDFLKIDIEGAENQVLFDLADDLGEVDHLFFEYHSVQGEPQRLGDMLSLVSRCGFRYTINGTHGPSLPFVEKARLGFDLQCNVFCFRSEPFTAAEGIPAWQTRPSHASG